MKGEKVRSGKVAVAEVCESLALQMVCQLISTEIVKKLQTRIYSFINWVKSIQKIFSDQ